MQGLKDRKGPKFDLETFKLAVVGVSLISGMMGAIYFYTLNIPIYIAGAFAVATAVVHLPFFFKKGK